MKLFNLLLYFNVGCILQSFVAADYYLKMTSNSPVVIGGTVLFNAELTDDDEPAEGSFMYSWQDNSLQEHTREFDTTQPYDLWNVTYTDCPPGPYEMQITVSKKFMLWYREITSQRLSFKLTDELNGNMDILQHNKTIQNFVSNNLTVVHKISLKESDATYLKNSTTSILTYWFVDCEYFGVTNDFTFARHYNETDKKHHVEALVVAGYEPITTTTVPTTTTTTTTTTTIKPTTTTSTTTTATPKPKTNITENTTPSNKVKRDISNVMELTTTLPHEFVIYNGSNAIISNNPFNPESPLICNGSLVPLGMNSTFGYFAKTFTVKAPVQNLAITGNNWIQQGNILELDLGCKGSKPFMYCLNYYPGIYNVTGNETCTNPFSLVECKFAIQRYYSTPGSHTIVVIITNEVYKLITPITVTVYEVTKQAQLSVIVVPVAFSIVAIVLIVFGIAYHLQNRRRFTVEVADFNFGPQYADYMTFRERLRDSIMNAFTRATVNTEDSDSGPIWPPNQKYGSMPRF